ncbi:MAG: ATP-binding cassette domain-containing protein, partial [Myxococcota bacterium]
MINVEGLSKTYQVARKQAGLRASIRGLFVRPVDEVRAVDDVTFSIATGERVGFLGPNGAGKTTTLKMLCGLLTPTTGRVEVLGLDPRQRPKDLLKQISLVMGQKQQLLWDLPPMDTIELNRAVYEVPPGQFKQTLDELTELLQLGDVLTKPTRQLSLGERMKCELAAALIHRPRVLFLDEPTIGLDVNMQVILRRFIQDYNERHGATVILTSHYMDDVAALCPRIIVIRAGRLAYDGDLAQLVRDKHPDRRVRVQLERPSAPVEAGVFGDGVQVVEQTDAQIEFRVPPTQLRPAVQAMLAQLPIRSEG